MIEKILVILPTPIAVGDLTMMQALFIYLKAKNPHAIIDVLAAQKTPELIYRMAEIHRVIPSPLVHGKLNFISRYRLAQSLRTEHYDQAIILSTSFKAGLVPWLARIPLRTGFRRKHGLSLLNDTQLLPRPRLPRMVQRFLSVALKPGEQVNEETYWPKMHADIATVNATLKKLQLAKEEKPLLILCPGSAGGISRRWPISYFTKLAEYFLTQGWHVWSIGGPAEKTMIAEMNAALTTPTIDLSNTSLLEALDLMSLATVVVANDSGLMHVASALSVPVVAIYGAGSPEFTPPLSHKAKILYKNLSCQPCYKKECPLQHLNCLNQISVDEVKDTVETLAKNFTRIE